MLTKGNNNKCYLKIAEGIYCVVANQNVETPWTIEIILFFTSFESLTDNDLKFTNVFTKVKRRNQKINSKLAATNWLNESYEIFE